MRYRWYDDALEQTGMRVCNKNNRMTDSFFFIIIVFYV